MSTGALQTVDRGKIARLKQLLARGKEELSYLRPLIDRRERNLPGPK